MRVLILRPGYRALKFATFASEHGHPLVRGTVRLAAAEELPVAMSQALRQITEEYLSDAPSPELCVIRGAHDGRAFAGPTVVSRETLTLLQRSLAAAPLHLPPTVHAAEAMRRELPGLPAVVVFETSFFAELPVRERLYALDRRTRTALGAVRSGYHGLFHAESAEAVARYRHGLGRRAAARVASVCLEPRPEVAAILGQRPLLVTSGATPLEGLPGEHTTGETDPGILLALARTQAMGPDELNELFTREGGLSALCGRTADLGEILAATDADTVLAREVFTHRLLIACGSAAAALGGLDALVFSGRFASAGAAIQGPLVQKLALALRECGGIDVLTVDRSLDQILARVGVETWERGCGRQHRGPASHPHPHSPAPGAASSAP